MTVRDGLRERDWFAAGYPSAAPLPRSCSQRSLPVLPWRSSPRFSSSSSACWASRRYRLRSFQMLRRQRSHVSIAYPGASANVLIDSVIIPLEQSINGVQNMRYIVSDATSAGEATIRVFFEPGTDPNVNVVNVQNRVNIMLSRLPPLVVREGILVSQVVPSMLMYVNLYSKDPNTDQKDLFNYANVRHAVPQTDQGHGDPHQPGQPNVRHAHLVEP